MLTQPTWDVQELATASQLPIDVTRRCLDTLAELALLGESSEHPGRVRPVRPDIGLQRLWQQREYELLARQEAIAHSYLHVSQWISQYQLEQRRSRWGRVEILNGLDAVRDYLAEVALWAESSIEALVPSGPQPEEAIEAAQKSDLQALSRGVVMRSIYLTSAANNPATRRHLRWLTDQGALVRIIPVLPLRMVLVDRRQAILPIDPSHTSRGVFVLTGDGVMTALGVFFDKFWEDAQAVGERHADAAEEINAQERELLRLLAEGYTDQIAARQLGVSLRTVRRMVASLMTRLGAKSRFEAGIRLAERHWL
jgi:DNA-binding CsgD family transcriptional regulator